MHEELLATAKELTAYFEEGLRDEPDRWKELRRGTQIVESLPNFGRPNVNVIPSTGVPSHCHKILFVAIGAADSSERRMLEAYEHISAKCPSATRGIIFYAARWDALAWIRHEQSFRRFDVSAVLKLPFMKPQRLI